MKHKRIILTGFMGTGKTAVGAMLAKKLNYTFLDTDLMVEKDVGKTVAQIFEKEGEAVFRGHESRMLRKALGKDKIVLATGGGAVVDPENLKLIQEKGVIIGLSASPEVILERISKMETRPLLKTKDQMKKIKELLSQRSPYYREANHIIDTTSKAIEKTVAEILKALS